MGRDNLTFSLKVVNKVKYLFSNDIQDITIVSHDCKDVVVTDNFALMHIWDQTEDPLPAGTNSVIWEENAAGQVPDGIYICHLRAGSESFTSRMVRLR